MRKFEISKMRKLWNSFSLSPTGED